MTTSEETWDEVMAINLKSMFLTFRAFFPLIKDSGASVVNVSSVQAVGALPNSVAYVTSKHGIAGLTRALAIDHAVDNIRVNCVCPGAVDTPMLRASMQNTQGAPSLLQEIGQAHALGRIARPEEIAKMIAFLCSEDASFITGGVYLVDGGMTALVAGKPPGKTGKRGMTSLEPIRTTSSKGRQIWGTRQKSFEVSHKIEGRETNAASLEQRIPGSFAALRMTHSSAIMR